jgi:hypothetical protein
LVIPGWGDLVNNDSACFCSLIFFPLSSRLLKNAHLRRYPHSSLLRRTSMYASLFGISGALHPDVFEQPEQQVFFSNLLVS